jgi:transcriptional regulator with XRE-family HTH domain
MKTDRQRRIGAVLERRGQTQDALAKRMGVSPAYLSQLLHGKRRGTVRVLLALAAETGVDIKDLAGRG